MTIIAALAVRPKNGSKPYILFGSDSLQVTYEVEDGTKVSIARKEYQQKIYRIKNKLFAFNGLFETELIGNLIEYLENNLSGTMDITNTTSIVLEFINSHMNNDKSISENITVVIGQLDNEANPHLVTLKVDRLNNEETKDEHFTLESYPDYRLIVSGVNPPIELVERLQDKIESGNMSNTIIGGNVEFFLKEVAMLFPEECNQNIRIVKLR